MRPGSIYKEFDCESMQELHLMNHTTARSHMPYKRHTLALVLAAFVGFVLTYEAAHSRGRLTGDPNDIVECIPTMSGGLPASTPLGSSVLFTSLGPLTPGGAYDPCNAENSVYACVWSGTGHFSCGDPAGCVYKFTSVSLWPTSGSGRFSGTLSADFDIWAKCNTGGFAQIKVTDSSGSAISQVSLQCDCAY